MLYDRKNECHFQYFCLKDLCILIKQEEYKSYFFLEGFGPSRVAEDRCQQLNDSAVGNDASQVATRRRHPQ